ncbi:MAG: hypothetical protein R3F43_19350 [bacterium]
MIGGGEGARRAPPGRRRRAGWNCSTAARACSGPASAGGGAPGRGALDTGRVGLDALPWQVGTHLGVLLVGGTADLALRTPRAAPGVVRPGAAGAGRRAGGRAGAAFFDATTWAP